MIFCPYNQITQSHIFICPYNQITQNEVLPATRAGQGKVEQLLLAPGMFPPQDHLPSQHAILVKHVTAFTIGQPAYSVGYFILHQAHGTENWDCSKLRH